MSQPTIFPSLLQSLARIFPRPGGKRARSRNHGPAKLQLESLESRIVPTAPTYTLPLVNDTGLNPVQESVYVLGFSTASQMALQSNGQFASLASGPANGTIQSFDLRSMPAITLSSATALTGARLYFFVAPPGQAPSLSYTEFGGKVTQPTNPPNSNYPPFDIAEITVPDPDTGTRPTLDVQTVDGFIFPMTLTLNNNLGQVGQPLANPTITRASILEAYQPFMNAQGAAGVPYQALAFGPNSIAGQSGGVVNPGSYLAAGANPSSALNHVWDADLTTLFQTPGRHLSMIGDDGAYYKGTPIQLGSGQWVIQFIGYTDAAETITNGNIFNIYNPLTKDPLGSYQTNETAGEMVFANDGVFADTSTNVLIAQNGNPLVPPTSVVKGLERDLAQALNRGVALLGPTDGKNGDSSTYWQTETNWYPAGQTQNLFSLFMHTATVNGTPIFALPPGAVKDAQGVLMSSAYGFAYDETPTHGPANQPNVPSKFDPVPAGTNTIAITLGPWGLPTPSNPSPNPLPTPSSNGFVALLFLAEQELAFGVDSVYSRFSDDPLFTQAADRALSVLNDLLHLENVALGTGLSGLQSAIAANPFYGTAWGWVAWFDGLNSADYWFNPSTPV